MRKRARSKICISLADKQQCILIAAIMSLQKTSSALISIGERQGIAFSAHVPFSVSCGSLWLFKLFFWPRSMVASLCLFFFVFFTACLLNEIVSCRTIQSEGLSSTAHRQTDLLSHRS